MTPNDLCTFDAEALSDMIAMIDWFTITRGLLQLRLQALL
jgi:hypothetical protein